MENGSDETHVAATRRPFPYLSLSGAVVFSSSVVALVVLEMAHPPESPLAVQQARIFNVMLCLLIACLSSCVSLITAWCPIILGGDGRPWYWVVPVVLGWLVFVQVFDWASLIPQP